MSAGGHQRRSNTAPAAAGSGSLPRLASLALPSPGGLHSRTGSVAAAEDASFAGAQELASLMNAPAAASSSWLAAWPFGRTEDFDAPPPPLPPGTLPQVRLADFSRYLRSIGDQLERFERSREASQQRLQDALSPEELRASQGQGLVAAMRGVPAPFFQEAFEVDQRQLWEELVQVQSEEARQESLERLSAHLDLVEGHLVKEIAARTDNFFDASGYIQDVRGSVARLFEQVAALRHKMHELEQETAAAVQTSQRLQRQRANLMATLDALRAMEGVAQAQSALQGLLPRGGGVAADYAGAIDVLEVLQGVLDDEALLALDCFKHLPDQIVETAQAVDDLMTSEFLERTRFADQVQAAATAGILDRLRAQLASAPTTPWRRRSSASGSASSSRGPSRQLSAEESAELGALAVLRVADTAVVDRMVGWLERSAGISGGAAAAAAAAAAEEDGGGETLQEVLLPLVIGLRRMGRLPATMRDFTETAAAGLKELLSQVVQGCLDVLDPESAPGDFSHLLAGPRSISPNQGEEGPPGSSVADRLQRLPGQDFQWVLEAVVLAVKLYLNHCTAVEAAVETILTAAKASKQQLVAAAHDARECCQAVAEAAVARWSKFLSSRARSSSVEAGGGSSVRLSELQGVLELTDALASMVEQYGVRGVLGLRSALQQLCKASLDGMHSKALSKLTTLLDQEQWMAVQVAPQFQEIVLQLEQRGAGAGAVGAEAAAGSGADRRPSPFSSSDGAAAAEGISIGAVAAASAAAIAVGSEEGQAEVARKFTITPQDSAAAPPAQPNGSTAAAAVTAGNGSGGGGSIPAMVLQVAGQGYHVVNTQLILLSMLREYLAFRDAVPAFSAEVAQRVLELLKVFNSRTCQLVLGAGAMQVSGLKSITAKHLALCCQCLGAFMALHPALVAVFTAGVQPPRRGMLVADFGRALQDYRLHHEEVCSKLVGIMRERLSVNIKQLPALAAGWHGGGTGGGSGNHEELPAPSPFAATAAKQLQILSGALAPLLLPVELHSIFGRIGLMFSRTLAEAYELLEPHGPAWEQQLRADMQFLLNCLRNLPMDPAERDSNLERLTQAFEQRFMLAGAAATHMPEPRRRTASAPAATAAAGAAAAVPVTPAAVAPAAAMPATADILSVAAAVQAPAAAMPAALVPIVSAAELRVDPAPAAPPTALAAEEHPVPFRHEVQQQDQQQPQVQQQDQQQPQVQQLQEEGPQQQEQQHAVADLSELPMHAVPQQLPPPQQPPLPQQQPPPGAEGHLDQVQLAPGSYTQQQARTP